MKKETSFIIATSLFLNSCAPMVAKALDNSGDNAIKITTPTQIPTFEPTSAPTQIPYEIPTLETVITIPTIEETKTPDILYFSQKKYKNQLLEDGTPWNYSGCGIMVGAMITKTDPIAYYNEFNKYFKSIGKYGPSRITRYGSDLEDHRAVLENLGYTFEQIDTENKELKDILKDVKEMTDKGIPVIVKANIWDGYDWYGHYTIAVRVDENNNIVYNDPVYGEGVTIPDTTIFPKEFYAVFPPAK